MLILTGVRDGGDIRNGRLRGHCPDKGSNSLGLGLGRRHGWVRSCREPLGVSHSPRLVVPVRLDMAVDLASQLGGTGHKLLDGNGMAIGLAECKSIGAQGQEGNDGVDLDHLDGYGRLIR